MGDECGWGKWADLLWVRRILGSSWWFRDMCWHLETSWGTWSWMTMSEDELRGIWIEIRRVVDELCWIRDLRDEFVTIWRVWSDDWATAGRFESFVATRIQIAMNLRHWWQVWSIWSDDWTFEETIESSALGWVEWRDIWVENEKERSEMRRFGRRERTCNGY